MAEVSKIEWCDSTQNFWLGCTKLSKACDNCYSEALNARYGWVEWGPHGIRKRTKTWGAPLGWQRNAGRFQAEHGRRQRVFTCSLSDFFDNKAPKEWRDEAWTVIRDTPDLDWLILTKRPENIRRFLPADWGSGYPNVWLGTTTEDQENFDRRWPKLAAIPAVVRFISYEPAVGPLRFPDTSSRDGRPDWTISGGESGPGARISDPQWFRDLRDDCRDYGSAYFFKQFGNYGSNAAVFERGLSKAEAERLDPKANGKGGALLDGRLWREFPVTEAPSFRLSA
jgi:protein gp37